MGITHSKLKKRLRKKYHVGEYQEFGFEIFVIFKPQLTESEFDEFYDEFIVLIEANKLLFGGGGDLKSWQGFITSSKKDSSPMENEREIIKAWLEKRSEIMKNNVSELRNANHH